MPRDRPMCHHRRVVHVRDNPSIPCRSCGAQLIVRVGDERVACEHCHASTVIPPALRRELAAHADVIAHVHAQTRQLGEQAQMHRLAARTNLPLLIAILVFACAVPAWIMAHGLGVTRVMSPLAWTVAVLLTASPLLVIAIATRRWRTRERTRIDRAHEPGRCGACGGPLALAEGAGLLRCAHCGATVVATPEQLRRLEHAAEQRRRGAHDEVTDASAANAGSLAGFNRGLEWLLDGPLGFGAFFAVALQVVGLIMFLAMIAAPGHGMARAAWISLATCSGLGLLGLLWGLVTLIQRKLWDGILARSGPRWQPRWTLVRAAIGATPAAAVCSIAGFTMIAVGMVDPRRPDTEGAAFIMAGLGFGYAFLALLFAAGRLLLAIARAALGRLTTR